MAVASTRREKSFFQSRMQRGEALTALLFLLPWIIGFLWFTAIPMGIALYVSITNYTIGAEPEIIGAANFTKLWYDQRLWHAFGNTLIYAVISVPLYLVMSLLAALMLNWNIFGIRTYRTIFYLPSITPAVASSILWLWIFNPQSGLANAVLQFFGLETQSWLWDPSLTKPVLIFIGLWGIGPTMIIFLAGLQSIGTDLYEAARVDGANSRSIFRFITLPLLRPVILFQVILSIIGAMQTFDVPVMLAGGTQSSAPGGTGRSGLVTMVLIFWSAFKYQQFGYASAMAFVLFVLIVCFSLAYNRWQGGNPTD